MGLRSTHRLKQSVDGELKLRALFMYVVFSQRFHYAMFLIKKKVNACVYMMLWAAVF